MVSALDLILQHETFQDKKILHFYKRYELTSSLSYEDIYLSSLNYARNLKSIIKEKRIPVLISLETSQEFVYSFFGILMAGHIPVPVVTSSLMLPKDFSELIEHILTEAKTSYMISNLPCKIKNLNHISIEKLYQPNSSSFEISQIETSDICFLQFSSGSTQKPKGVAITHKNIMTNLAQISEGMQTKSHDKICSWLPLYHDMGLIGVLLSTLYCGGTAHLMSPLDFIFSPFKWLKLISKNQVSIMVAPNAAYASCVKKIKDQELSMLNLSSIRLALSGAEPVSENVCARFQKHFKKAKLKADVMFPVYGLAEATLAVTFPKLDAKFHSLKIDENCLNKSQKVKILDNENSDHITTVSCGYPLSGIQLEIRKDNVVCQENEVGEIYLTGENVAKQYFNKKGHLQNTWLPTGDLGFMNKGMLYIVGRIKDLIIINGKNIAANDLEAKASFNSQYIKQGKIVAFSTLISGQEEVKMAIEVCRLDKNLHQKIREEAATKLGSIIPITPKDIYITPPLCLKKTTSGKVKRYEAKMGFAQGKIQHWQKYYTFYYLRSTLIMGLIGYKYILKIGLEKIFNKKQSVEINHELSRNESH